MRLLFTCVVLLLTASVSAKTTHHRTPAPVDYVYIVNTGSFDIPGYRVYLGSNGKLSAVYLPRTGRHGPRRTGSLTPLVTRRIFADLKQAYPINALPQGAGLDTNLSGTAPEIRIYLLYHNRQSPDLRNAASTAGKNLYQDVKQAIQAVRMPVPNVP